MDSGTDFKKAYPGRLFDFLVAVLGNTTSAPTIPLGGSLSAATSTFPLAVNSVSRVAAEAPTRTNTGIYTITYKHAVKTVIPHVPVVVSAGASPTTALCAICTSVVPTTRVLTVKVYTPTGTLTDLGVNDMLILTCTGHDAG